jgi:WD40 repeat protein
VTAVVLTPDGRRAVSASRDKALRVWELETGQELVLLTGDAAVFCCAVSLDGRTIVAGDDAGTVHFLRLVEADKTKPPIGKEQARSATDS